MVVHVWIQRHFPAVTVRWRDPLSTIHPSSQTMTEAETIVREETAKSINAIRKIDELLENPLFQSYREGIERKAAEMGADILEGRVYAERREEMRHERIGLLSGLRMLADEREGHVLILRQHGVEV